MGLKRFLCLLKRITDEEQGEERTHHSDDRFLAGRLERDQEKVLRQVLPVSTNRHRGHVYLLCIFSFIVVNMCLVDFQRVQRAG